MWRKLIAVSLTLAVPASASAGPIREAVEKAARELAVAQQQTQDRNRSRFFTGVALLVGGGVLAALGMVELGDDETGPDDGEDANDSDDGEDSDGWGNTALLGGGIAAAAVGGVLLLTGRRSGPVVTTRSGRVMVRQTVRF
ncbi:MAG: hypothetical protein ACRD3C_22220 [Vicinamibacterales bacterium]